MKKLLFTIIAMAFISIAIAQKPCTTIQEVRSQANDTEVCYTGTATTTFHTSGGILIQDATGYLYLKNSALTENGAAKIKPKMNITNIVGKFKASADSEMARIELYTDEAKGITKVEENVSFTITDITLEQLQAKPMDYECRPIRLTDVATFEANGAYYLGTSDNKTPIQKGWDVTIPARGTFEGYYAPDGFTIPSKNHVIATAYKTILSFKEAFSDKDPQSTYGLVDPIIVSYVRKNADNSLDVYAQQSIPSFGGMYETYGILLKIEACDKTITAGDQISGIKGLFSNFSVNNNGKINHGTTMTISATDAKNITIESRNNKIRHTQIDDLEYIIDANAISYESIFCVTPKGTITKSGDKYTLVAGKKSVFLEGIDLSPYEGQNLAVAGIVDPGNINQEQTTIILRKETDIISTSYTFNSIAEMKEAGEPLATGTTYTLSSNALVTHIHSRAGVDVTIYEIFVQDSTAGLYMETYFDPEITAGDTINGITGAYHGYLLQHEGTTFNIVTSNNLDKIQPKEVNMKTLAENPQKYASTVVKLMNVKHGTREVTNIMGETTTEKYLYQDVYTMIYDTNVWDYTLYEYSNIIGVFDYDNKTFSIIPLSQGHIEEGKYIDTTTNITFLTIAEMQKAGATLDTNTTYTLNSNVLVTHVHTEYIPQSQLTISNMFIQDSTGAMFVTAPATTNIVAGDSIRGIVGTLFTHANAAPTFALKNVSSLVKLSSNNIDNIQPKEVTIKMLAESPQKYASSIIELKGIKHGTREETNNQGETITTTYIYQDKDTMIYDAKLWNYKLYETNTIVGVFDYGCYQSFSIIPLSQNHIKEEKTDNLNSITIDNNLIFNSNKDIIATNATNIKIYNIKGQFIIETNSDRLNLSNLPNGIYLVITKYKDETIKTTKIINY